MAAGLNHMVARQSKISFSRGSSWPRDRTRVSRIGGRRFNLWATREVLKYKNTVSENLLERHRTLDLSINIKDFKGGKEARLKEEGGGGGRWGAKGVALQMSPATYRCPGVLGLFPEPPEKGGLELALSAIRPDQNQNSSSLPRGGDQSPILSSGWGPFDQIPASRTGGLEKQGRIGRVKERKERGKGERGQ